ncbi:hypothetical protein HCC70_07690 [Streptococcus suis]|uniref:Uncharacterized protein n=1 Tax=Streptococcus suivaginalis TaxID=3028082 RepID=A0AA96VBJ0_9STRE|nr:hypothetical protein [Streptococcus sp. 29896]MCK4028213.1 hypothetical protein [Streptococcus suis]WNY46690.1 hypothetical protein PXH68_07275 [Streptococcus sp. 29896]
MEIIGEVLVEFLTGLADFDERKYPPFGLRYWLGWLAVVANLLLLGFLGFVTVVFFLVFMKGGDWLLLVSGLLLAPFLLFWFLKTMGHIRKMWRVTLYYKQLS